MTKPGGRAGDWFHPENIARQEEAARAGAGDGARDIFAAYRELARGATSEHAGFHAILDPSLAAAHARRVKGLLPPDLAVRSLLDIGCGPGAVTEALRVALNASVAVGVDASRDAVAFATRTFPACRFAAAVFTAETSFEEAFDLVYSREFYPFTRTCDPALQGPLLEALGRHVGPGGLLTVVILDAAASVLPALPDLQPSLTRAGLRFLGVELETSPRLGFLPAPLARALTRAVNRLRRRPNRVFLLWRKDG